jgi:hypothetical protein
MSPVPAITPLGLVGVPGDDRIRGKRQAGHSAVMQVMF